MCELANRGVRIPKDISITGFDDSTYAEALQLTTAKQDPRSMAVNVATKILQSLREEHVEHPFEEFKSEIIVRSTTTFPSTRD